MGGGEEGGGGYLLVVLVDVGEDHLLNDSEGAIPTRQEIISKAPRRQQERRRTRCP